MLDILIAILRQTYEADHFLSPLTWKKVQDVFERAQSQSVANIIFGMVSCAADSTAPVGCVSFQNGCKFLPVAHGLSLVPLASLPSQHLAQTPPTPPFSLQCLVLAAQKTVDLSPRYTSQAMMHQVCATMLITHLANNAKLHQFRDETDSQSEKETKSVY